MRTAGRYLWLLAMPITACASAGSTGGSARPRVAPTPTSTATVAPVVIPGVPPVLTREPWIVAGTTPATLVLTHRTAALRLAPQLARFERRGTRIFDTLTTNVSFNYVTDSTVTAMGCRGILTATIYPATQSIADELRPTIASVQQAMPGLQADTAVLRLDREHGGTGVHAAFQRPASNATSYESVSVYQRDRWFVKYRVSLLPAHRPECEQLVRDAITAMQHRP